MLLFQVRFEESLWLWEGERTAREWKIWLVRLFSKIHFDLFPKLITSPNSKTLEKAEGRTVAFSPSPCMCQHCNVFTNLRSVAVQITPIVRRASGY